MYISIGGLRLITGGGLPPKTSPLLDNSNFEVVDVDSLMNNMFYECEAVPPFPYKMWGAVSTMAYVSWTKLTKSRKLQ